MTNTTKQQIIKQIHINDYMYKRMKEKGELLEHYFIRREDFEELLNRTKKQLKLVDVDNRIWSEQVSKIKECEDTIKVIDELVTEFQNQQRRNFLNYF